MADENSTATELPKEAWFRDLPVEVGSVDAQTIDSAGTPTRLSPRQLALVNPFANQQSERQGPAIMVDSDDLQDANANALTDLLRSYVNIRPGGKRVGGGGQAASRPNDNAGDDLLSPESKRAASEALASLITVVVRPGAGNSGLATVSVFGLGEFAFLGDGEDVTVSLGELFSFSLSDLFGAGASGGGYIFGRDDTTLSMGLSGQHAYSEAGNAGGGGGTAENQGAIERGGQRGRDSAAGDGQEGDNSSERPFMQLPTLLFEIITYPGTILVLLFLLSLKLGKEALVFSQRTKAARQAKRRRARRRRSSSVALTQPQGPVK